MCGKQMWVRFKWETLCGKNVAGTVCGTVADKVTLATCR